MYDSNHFTASCLMCMVGTGENYKMENCVSQNYTSCVTIKTKQLVDNTSSTTVEKKCGFSKDYTSNNETLEDDDIKSLYGGIGKEEFYALENGCSYLNETDTNICRCLSNLCNIGSSMKNINIISFLLTSFIINVFLAMISQ